MSGWIPIGEPEPQALTPTEQRVKELLDAGYNYKLIAMIMRMSYDTTKDMIYEIRKKEGIMRKATITDAEKQTMKQMFADGKTVQEIAKATGRGRSSVDRIVNDRKPAQINTEFDAAVNEMIAESKSADATKTDFDEILETDVADCPECLPPAVVVALTVRIHDLEDEIAHLTAERNELTEFMEGRA